MSQERTLLYWDKCKVYQGFTSTETKDHLKIKKVLGSVKSKIRDQLSALLNNKFNIRVEDPLSKFLEFGKADKYFIDDEDKLCMGMDLYHYGDCMNWIMFFSKLDCDNISMDIIFYDNKEARHASTMALANPHDNTNYYSKCCVSLPPKMGGYDYMYRDIFIVTRIVPSKYRKSRTATYLVESTEIYENLISKESDAKTRAFLEECYDRNRCK